MVSVIMIVGHRERTGATDQHEARDRDGVTSSREGHPRETRLRDLVT